MKLSIVIPCYNEAKTLRSVVDKVLAVPLPGIEVIIVDDGSTDGTVEILRQEIEPIVDQVIYRPENGGKGASLRTGFAAATGDVIVVQDADHEYDPMELPRLFSMIATGEADVVYGSRFMDGRHHRRGYWRHRVGNHAVTFLSNRMTGMDLSDMETCYKMFRRDIIRSIDLEEDGFGIEPEITAKIARKGYRIREVGISYHPRTYEEGKKIGWRDGLRAIYVILKYNLRHWFRAIPWTSVSVQDRAESGIAGAAGENSARIGGGPVKTISIQ